MGRYKEQMIDEWPYTKAPNKKVCSAEFTRHRYIKERIDNSNIDDYCDYCGAYSAVLPLDTIIPMVYDEFEQYFENPAEELPFESGGEWGELEGSGMHKEGSGYILPDGRSIMTTDEAMDFAGFAPDSEDLYHDIVGCFCNNDWVLKDAFSLTDEERMSDNWDNFWKGTIADYLGGMAYEKIRTKYEYLLNYMSEEINSNLHSLTSVLNAGSMLYRCVNYKDVPNPLKDTKLWAPPVEYASSQRMSREGQSRLYASFDKETPIREAVSGGEGTHHCLGEFKLKQSIKVLDFTNLPAANILNVPDFIAYRFFHRFARAITIPVTETEKHKYIPTQLMRDIIEDRFMNLGIMGIKYRSVKGEGTENLVLFLDNNTCSNYLELTSSSVVY